MGHYRFYQLDTSDHITAGHSVECGSDAAALRAARTLLERTAGVEVWKNDNCVAHLSAEARHLWAVAGRLDGVLLAGAVVLLSTCGRLHDRDYRRCGRSCCSTADVGPGLVPYRTNRLLIRRREV